MKRHRKQNDRQASSDEADAQGVLRVLLIEDDVAMREMLADALHSAGWHVTGCGSVSPWLQASVVHPEPGSGADECVFDVVVSDIRMPGMSGLDAMRVLRETGCSHLSPPAILITAFGDEDTHEEARQLGAAAVLDKPFDTARLIEAIREVARPQGIGRRS